DPRPARLRLAYAGQRRHRYGTADAPVPAHRRLRIIVRVRAHGSFPHRRYLATPPRIALATRARVTAPSARAARSAAGPRERRARSAQRFRDAGMDTTSAG